GDLSAGWDVEIVGSGSRVTVTTVVSVLGGGPVTVTVSVVPPPHAATATTSARRKISRPTHGSLVLHVAHLAVTAAPLLSRLRAEACVLLELERTQLSSKLHIAVEALCLERPVRDRSPYGAIRLMQMRAVGEATTARDLDDLRKRRVEHGLVRPERELAHPGGIEEERPSRKWDELAVRRRVPAAPVLARLRGREQLLLREAVDQGRLADPRRAEERDGSAAAEVPIELLEAGACRRTDGVHRHAEGDRFDFREVFGRIQGRVALVHDDDRSRAAVPRRGQVPLQAPRIQILAERGDEEDGVDVRRDHLRDGAAPGLLARERRPAREDGFDDALPLAVELLDRDPVSRHRQVEPFQLPGGEPADAPVLGEELARAVMPRGDARGYETFMFVRSERICEECVPAEIFELQRDSLGLRNEKAPGRARTRSLRSG